MKKIFLTFIFSAISFLLLANQVTVYNDNFSLIRTDIKLDLQKGVQNYFFEDIPSTINPKSVMFLPKDKRLQIFSQNYEYDLANAEQIMQKYINEEVEIITDEDHIFNGLLQFSQSNIIGIIENNTKKLILINREEIRNITLAKLPKNFFLKPTLRWKLNAPKKAGYNATLSYLCGGMKWDATYNCIWNPITKKLQVNSWVSLQNYSGKSFQDVKLKLIAGDVNRARQNTMERYMDEDALMSKSMASPEFSEKSFHDFHLYTLDQNISIANKQIKQLQLFPSLSIIAEQKYKYHTGGNKVSSIISFKNRKEQGLGFALPKGSIKIYQQDDADNSLEFIGEDYISHTPIDEEIDVKTGSAFDLSGKTTINDSKKISRTTREKSLSVLLKNSGKKNKTIEVIHKLSGNWEILSNNIKYEKIDAFTIKFEKKILAGEKFEIVWIERSEY